VAVTLLGGHIERAADLQAADGPRRRACGQIRTGSGSTTSICRATRSSNGWNSSRETHPCAAFCMKR
jgi:hypothetical protein